MYMIIIVKNYFGIILNNIFKWMKNNVLPELKIKHKHYFNVKEN